MTATMVPDWAQMFDDLRAAGVASAVVAAAMGTQLTHRMLRCYRTGAQPTYWRGRGLVALWCAQTGRELSEVPLTELQRGYRAQGSYDAGPRLQELPKWPVAVPVAVAPVKRKAGRPRKAESVA